MKEKRPRGRGRGPSLRLWKATRLLLYAAWTFYPQIEARQLFIRSQPRKTGHLVSLHVSRGGGWGGGREEDPEKSRVYNSRLNFCPCFWRGSIFRWWSLDDWLPAQHTLCCLLYIFICRWIEIREVEVDYLFFQNYCKNYFSMYVVFDDY